MTTDLAALGWDDHLRRSYARHARSDRSPGRATQVDRGVCTVLTAGGAVRASLSGALLAAGAADPVALPCAGDWLVIRLWPDRRRTVEAVLPRRTALVQRAAGIDAAGDAVDRVLAGNIDAVAVVEPMDPTPDLGRIEWLLAVAGETGAWPLIVLTKADLAADPAAVALRVATAAPGVGVHPVCVRTGAGLAPLRRLLAGGRTVALLSPSGAGRSSLVDALAGGSVLGAHELRPAPTGWALVPLPGGGVVLDTPGVRAVGLLGGGRVDRGIADGTDRPAGGSAPTGVAQPGDVRRLPDPMYRWKRPVRERRRPRGRKVVRPRG